MTVSCLKTDSFKKIDIGWCEKRTWLLRPPFERVRGLPASEDGFFFGPPDTGSTAESRLWIFRLLNIFHVLLPLHFRTPNACSPLCCNYEYLSRTLQRGRKRNFSIQLYHHCLHTPSVWRSAEESTLKWTLKLNNCWRKARHEWCPTWLEQQYHYLQQRISEVLDDSLWSVCFEPFPILIWWLLIKHQHSWLPEKSLLATPPPHYRIPLLFNMI